jgi:hypothetical protein
VECDRTGTVAADEPELAEAELRGVYTVAPFTCAGVATPLDVEVEVEVEAALDFACGVYTVAPGVEGLAVTATPPPLPEPEDPAACGV